MLTVSQLVGKGSCAVELENMKLWNMRADKVMPSTLSAFFHLSKHLTNHNVAKNCINHILNCLKGANQNGLIRNESIMDYDGIVDPFFSFELRQGLESLPLMQARCVYFALLSGLPMPVVTQLTWAKARRLKSKQIRALIGDAALDVIDAMPVNLTSPLVFWQYDDQRNPVPLSYIEEDVLMAFDMTYEDLVQCFNRMVLIDYAEDMKVLLNQWKSEQCLKEKLL